jgi:hypothetical protein
MVRKHVWETADISSDGQQFNQTNNQLSPQTIEYLVNGTPLHPHPSDSWILKNNTEINNNKNNLYRFAST